jgi:hypothetical protein
MKIPLHNISLSILIFILILLMTIVSLGNCDKDSPSPTTGPIPGNGITILSPNYLKTYSAGDTLTITWTLENTSVSGLQIDFSQNGGINYFNIAMIQPAFPEFKNRRVPWVIPDSIGNGGMRRSVRSDSCRIFIHDYFDYSINDISDIFFSIK